MKISKISPRSVLIPRPLPILSLNHVSRVTADVALSVEFYCGILGFQEIVRPDFDFQGAWLFAYGVGIHLIKGEPLHRPDKIDPRADHLSFQAESLQAVEESLLESGTPYVKQTVIEGGLRVHQVFIHDPDGSMIEICNCEVLPVIPLGGQRSRSDSCCQLPSHTGNCLPLHKPFSDDSAYASAPNSALLA